MQAGRPEAGGATAKRARQGAFFCFQPPKASTKWHEFNYYATKTGQLQSSGFVFKPRMARLRRHT
tara:strand:+ start:1180 stop:1374 length:195 start_codon:yes stop_codon:yes gene_type:complete